MSEAWRAVLSLHGDDDLDDDDLDDDDLDGDDPGEGDPPAGARIVRRDLGVHAGWGGVETDGVTPGRGEGDTGRRP